MFTYNSFLQANGFTVAAAGFGIDEDGRNFIHCPAGTSHIIIGAGTAPCAVLAIGAREHQGGASWGAYPVDDKALRRGAGVAEETTDPAAAYARFPKRELRPYREGWLPG